MGTVLTRTSTLWLIGLVLVLIAQVAPTWRLLAAQSDYVLHDTYYVVAHIRWVIPFGVIFTIFAAFYFWCERVWGGRYDDRLGKAHFALSLAGVALIFAPQYLLAFQGMPRRYVDYPQTFDALNRVTSVGYLVLLAGFAVFLLVCARAFFPPRSAEAA